MKQVYQSLETLHSTGFNHNDIKPSNIMIDLSLNATLIDLGFTESFMASKYEHLESTEVTSFRGNLLYSSLDQMLFKSTSRRDDMFSLTYLMFSLLNKNVFPALE